MVFQFHSYIICNVSISGSWVHNRAPSIRYIYYYTIYSYNYNLLIYYISVYAQQYMEYVFNQIEFNSKYFGIKINIIYFTL